jgi:hypothetical protein
MKGVPGEFALTKRVPDTKGLGNPALIDREREDIQDGLTDRKTNITFKELLV